MTLQNKFILLFIASISLVFSFTDNPVKYDIHFSKDRVAPGDDFSIDIDIEIDSGFLIYSPNPLNLSPTGIEWATEDSAYFGYISPMKEPESKIKFDPYTKMEVFYHTGSLTLKQNYKLNSFLTPGDTIILNGEFIYQACDDKICIPYSKIPNCCLSTVKGHKGEFIFGKFNNINVCIMSGRFHLYEGYFLLFFQFLDLWIL